MSLICYTDIRVELPFLSEKVVNGEKAQKLGLPLCLLSHHKTNSVLLLAEEDLINKRFSNPRKGACMTRESAPSSHFTLSPELDAIVQSSDIAYELISDGFGISADGIEHIVEQLQQTIPNLTITNGHVLALLLHELVGKAALENITCDVSPSTGEEDDEQLMRLKIDQKARTYYKGSSWDLLEPLAFCLKMVEIGYMNYLKKPASRSRREFLQQVVNAVRPASKLAAVGYQEAVQSDW